MKIKSIIKGDGIVPPKDILKYADKNLKKNIIKENPPKLLSKEELRTRFESKY
ncbi:MAG: hypothetical protein ACOCTT_00870 [archaeon]